MAQKIVQSRTVRFFEVVDLKTGLPVEGELPWSKTTTALAHSDVSVDDRTVKIAGEDHHGGPWSLSGYPDMLLFSKIREDFELPELFDRGDGTLTALQIAETQGVAETTHVGFFPSNIVGMIRTNTGPGAGSFERWVNAMALFDGLPDLAVQPLSRVSVTQRVQDIEEARGITIRARSTAGQALAGKAPRIADTFDFLQQKFGSVMVEMRIYTTRDHGNAAESEAIMSEATGLLALTADGQSIPDVDAAKLTFLSKEKEKSDDINMLKDKLAETVEVEVVDKEGKSTRRASAARAMQQAYNRLEKDLQTAVDRPRS